MKKLFLIFFLALTFESIWSQNLQKENLNKNMARYYEGCILLREGIINNDQIKLDSAIYFLNESDDESDALELNKLELTNVETLDEVPMQGHVYFNSNYAEHIYKEINEPFIDKVESLRGFPLAEQDDPCNIAHIAIKAQGRVTYELEVEKDCRMFVVTEPGGTVKLFINDDNNNPLTIAQEYLSGAVLYAQWVQPVNSNSVYITLENNSSKDISLVIAMN